MKCVKYIMYIMCEKFIFEVHWTPHLPSCLLPQFLFFQLLHIFPHSYLICPFAHTPFFLITKCCHYFVTFLVLRIYMYDYMESKFLYSKISVKHTEWGGDLYELYFRFYQNISKIYKIKKKEKIPGQEHKAEI